MDNNSFIYRYFERIGFTETPYADIDTLRKIQKQHLLSIPFENMDIINNIEIEFSINKIYEKVVVKNRGGICYELNGLLFHLLKRIGFNVKYLAAKVLEDGNEFDHVFLGVDIGSEIWLVDVGFGDNFLEPLKLVLDTLQEDNKGVFKIIKNSEGEYELLRQTKEMKFSLEHTFTLEERKLEDFKERCLYFQKDPKSRFNKNTVCSLEREDGRISLTDDRLIITQNGVQSIKSIKSRKEFLAELKDSFNIEITMKK